MTTMPAVRPWRLPMTGRDGEEPHRPSTALELLFDLTFVVAVAQVAVELAHSLTEGHPGEGVLRYAMVFFAIWWAWMNFSWFASAYDTDDVPYRLLTLVQMAGVLVLAAGVPAAFEEQDFRAVTSGYVIMRVAMVAQWLRAARSHPLGRVTALRYAAGIMLVQIGWLLRLAVPDVFPVAIFHVLVIAELAVPIWAERPRMTTWHPDHIAERYGLFVIIVLGECVLGATNAVQAALGDGGVTVDLLLVAGGGLLLLFGLWWLYFLRPAGEALRRRPQLSFMWGYLHYVVFASLAAVGAGLEVAVEAGAHHLEVSDVAVTMGVAVPVALFLVAFAVLHATLDGGTAPSSGLVLVAAVVVVVLAAAARVVPLAGAVALLAVPVLALVVAGVVTDHRAAVHSFD